MSLLFQRIETHSQNAIDYHDERIKLRHEYQTKHDKGTSDSWLLAKLQNMVDELGDDIESTRNLKKSCKTEYDSLRKKHRDMLNQIQQVNFALKAPPIICSRQQFQILLFFSKTTNKA